MSDCNTCKYEALTTHQEPCRTCINMPGIGKYERAVPIVEAPPAGRKDDGGKAPWGLLMSGCSAALAGVVAVLQFGARKYAADSWQRVEGAEERYKDALYRHLHSIETRGFLAKDPETGLLEWFHVACNSLFLATFAANHAKAEAEKETH